MSDAKILIVDDQPNYHAALQTRLENEGYWVLLASSGSSALEVANREKPIVAIIEQRLDGKITGIRLAEQLLTLQIPSFFYTSIDDRAYIEAASKVDALGYLSKETSLDIVVGQILASVRSRQSTVVAESIRLQLEQRLDARVKMEHLVGTYAAIWHQPVAAVRSQLNRFARRRNISLEQLADTHELWHTQYSEMYQTFLVQVDSAKPRTLTQLDDFHKKERFASPVDVAGNSTTVPVTEAGTRQQKSS